MKVPEMAGQEPHAWYGTAEERVARGITWLEENVGPTWFEQVTLDILDMANPCSCVLGLTVDEEVTDNLPGDERDALEEVVEKSHGFLETGYDRGTLLAVAKGEFRDPFLWAVYHGFDAWAPGDEEYEELQGVWTREITDRMVAAVKS